MATLKDLAEQALLAAATDGVISAEDFEDWEKFKRKVNKEKRKLFRRIEEEGVEVDAKTALLILALLS